MARLGGNMQAVAEQAGLAAAVGVVGPDLPLGETVFEDLAAALPPAREAGVAVFAWPETRWLGRKPGADALHLLEARGVEVAVVDNRLDGGPRSEEHTSELQSLMRLSYAVFCLEKKNTLPRN